MDQAYRLTLLELFLSTPSARRATVAGADPGRHFWNFYPRPPRGGRPKNSSRRCSIFNFYPRPPRGGRPLASRRPSDSLRFLSTPSARRATRGVGQPGREYAISIHALREEGDILKSPAARLRSHFYPRPPRGGRHLEVIVVLFPILFLSTPSARRATSGSASPSGSLIFLSTPSARRATDVLLRAAAHSSISIHALREEGDYNSCRPW